MWMLRLWDWSIYGLRPTAKFMISFWLISQTVLNISLPSLGISRIFWTEPFWAMSFFLISGVHRFYIIYQLPFWWDTRQGSYWCKQTRLLALDGYRHLQCKVQRFRCFPGSDLCLLLAWGQPTDCCACQTRRGLPWPFSSHGCIGEECSSTGQTGVCLERQVSPGK